MKLTLKLSNRFRNIHIHKRSFENEIKLKLKINANKNGLPAGLSAKTSSRSSVSMSIFARSHAFSTCALSRRPMETSTSRRCRAKSRCSKAFVSWRRDQKRSTTKKMIDIYILIVILWGGHLSGQCFVCQLFTCSKRRILSWVTALRPQ